MAEFEGHESQGYRKTVEIADDILALQPGGTGEGFGFWRIAAKGVDPVELYERVADGPAGGLLLPEGADFSIHDPSGYYEQIGVRSLREQLIGVTIQGYRAVFPYGQGDNHSVELAFVYTDGRTVAAQELTADAYSAHAQDEPYLSRKVVANDYLETGYEGHAIEFLRTPSTEQVLAVLAISQEILENHQ